MKFIVSLFIFISAVYEITSAAPQITHKKSSLQIIGGRNAKKGDAPWSASLQECFLSMICYHICGATILSPTWVVTAAHCLGQDMMYTYRVVTGVVTLNDADKDKQFEDVVQRVIYPLYNSSREEIQLNDIALLKLSRKLKINQFVKPISLAWQNVPVGQNALFSGWGSTQPESDKTAHNLQLVELSTISIDECLNAINTYLPENQIPISTTGSNICLGPTTGNVAPCLGDNGGPLVLNNDKLIAIASWMYEPCGIEGLPSVFTNIPSFKDWISLYVDDI